jgi:hypothetical protein
MNIYEKWYKKYLGAEFSVIPDRQSSHAPLIKNWTRFCDNRASIDEASTFIEKETSSNLAVCLGRASGIIALDLDCNDPEILDIILPFLPPSPVEKVGSKGWTRFFAFNGEHSQIVKHNGEVVIEILSSGKKTTIPPSIHPKTKIPYKWTDKGLLDVNKEDLPLLPPFLIPHIEEKLRFLKPSIESNQRGATRQITHGRNSSLSSLAAKLISNKVDLNIAIEELLKADKNLHENPLFEDLNEMRQPEPYTNALSFYTNHLLSINTRHFKNKEEYEIPAIVLQSPVEPKIPEKKEIIPIHNPDMSGTLKRIQDYILRNSYVKQPNFAFSSALILMSTLIGRKFIFQGLAPNLYILNVAPSGGGKDAPQQSMKRLLTAIGADSLLGSGDYVSDASLMTDLPTSPKRLDLVDEASGLLKSANSGKESYNGKIADILCELYTCSNDKFMGRMTADGRKGAAYRPYVNILASTTPRGLEESITKRSIAKGLLGRFLIYFGDHDKPAERVKSRIQMDQELLEELSYWHTFKPNVEHDFGKLKQEYIEVKATKQADELLDSYFTEVDNMRRGCGEDNSLLPIIARLYTMILKISLIHACSRVPYGVPEVGEEDVKFAKGAVEYFYFNMKTLVENHIFENWQEAKTMKLFNIIKANGKIATIDLSKATAFLSKKERDAILEDLRAQEKIEMHYEKVGKTQKPKEFIVCKEG